MSPLNAWAGLVGGTDVVSTSQEVDLRSWILRGLVIALAISESDIMNDPSKNP